MTEDFITKHLDLKHQVETGELKKYTRLSEHGRIQEYWERDENGELIDRTDIAKAKEKLELQKEEERKLKLKLARQKAMDNLANKGITL